MKLAASVHDFCVRLESVEMIYFALNLNGCELSCMAASLLVVVNFSILVVWFVDQSVVRVLFVTLPSSLIN